MPFVLVREHSEDMKNHLRKILLTGFFFLFAACATTPKPTTDGYDALLTGFPYPFEVSRYEFEIQGHPVFMAYMDVKPKQAPAGTIVLLHGKNFGGYYFAEMARFLTEQNYRVIIPDQIGFGKSSKPDDIQYSLHLLAQNTFRLIDSLEPGPVIVLGHSMGGMLATRMALMNPDKVKKLILVNPLGLEDYRLLTGYRSVDELLQGELKNSPERIKNYQMEYYYSGDWKPEYDALNQPAIGWIKGPDFAKTAKIAALTSEMVYTQPVAHEFSQLKVPTVLINGQLDRTAIGKAWAPETNKKRMGLYPQLGRRFKSQVKGAKLVEIPNRGHTPFIQDFAEFAKILGKELAL